MAIQISCKKITGFDNLLNNLKQAYTLYNNENETIESY